jgi:putative ABC transport system permease protein
MPLFLQLLLDESEKQLMSRANKTPLVIGAKGSALDLMMNSLYFGDDRPALTNLAAVEAVRNSGLARTIPVYARFKSRGFPIIGTDYDYFDFRGLDLAAGRMPAILGEAVIGANVAHKLDLEPGSSLISSPENLFDIAGVYPLKMNIVGILSQAGTPDDGAIFVDIKTAWVIEGLGHGHQDLVSTDNTGLILERQDQNVVANASVVEYNAIDSDNLSAFHFHGSSENFPISALLVEPGDQKSGAIIQGRYLQDEQEGQVLVPAVIIGALLDNIFRVKKYLNAGIVVTGIATALAVLLVFALSMRLRQGEMSTITILVMLAKIYVADAVRWLVVS